MKYTIRLSFNGRGGVLILIVSVANNVVIYEAETIREANKILSDLET